MDTRGSWLVKLHRCGDEILWIELIKGLLILTSIIVLGLLFGR